MSKSTPFTRCGRYVHFFGIAALLLLPDYAASQSLTINEGYDVFHTTGAGKHFGVSPPGFPVLPIPGEFFGPGYEDFADLMVLKSDSLAGFENHEGVLFDFSGLEGPENRIDTIIRRLSPIHLSTPGHKATIPVQMVELGMTSIEPITIHGPAGPEQWNVNIRATNNPTGTMTVSYDSSSPLANAGTYDAVIPVDGVFRFTRLSDGEQRVLDSAARGLPTLLFFVNDAPWMDRPINEGVPEFAVTRIDGLTSNFLAGYAANSGREVITGQALGYNCPISNPGSGWHNHVMASPTDDEMFPTTAVAPLADRTPINCSPNPKASTLR